MRGKVPNFMPRRWIFTNNKIIKGEKKPCRGNHATLFGLNRCENDSYLSYALCVSFTLDQKFVNKWVLSVSRKSLLQPPPAHRIART